MAMILVSQRSSPIARHFSQNSPKQPFWCAIDHAFLLAMHDVITERIIASAIKVHSVLGPGFLEKVYSRAFRIELAETNIAFEHEKRVPIFYERQHIASHVLDLVVDGTVVVELKACRELSPADYKQVRSYMRAAGLRIGLLINFAGARVDIRRVEHP